MIHYQLRCETGHEFDGWFKDSAGFDKQAAAGLVECPVCGGTKVARALMAPNIAKPREAAPPAPVAPGEGNGAMAAAGPMPAQMLALLQRLRAEVEKNCDYVGADFADRARALHREASEEGVTDQRGIYGEASEADTEALRDEGIEIGRLPWVPRADG